MKAKRISQREARRLRKELSRLREAVDRQLSAWTSEYPGGVCLGTHDQAQIADWVRVAQLCGRAVVVRQEKTTLRFMACMPLTRS